MNHMDLRLFLHKNVYTQEAINKLIEVADELTAAKKIEQCTDRLGVIIQLDESFKIDTYIKLCNLCDSIMLTWLNNYQDKFSHLLDLDLRPQIQKIYNIGKINEDTIIIML